MVAPFICIPHGNYNVGIEAGREPADQLSKPRDVGYHDGRFMGSPGGGARPCCSAWSAPIPDPGDPVPEGGETGLVAGAARLIACLMRGPPERDTEREHYTDDPDPS